MDERARTIRELHEKIDRLFRQQNAITEEILNLQKVVRKLEVSDLESTRAAETLRTLSTKAPVAPPSKENVPEQETTYAGRISSKNEKTAQPTSSGNNDKTPLEDFIGKNLLNKIGIAVLVVGVAFGTKYSIDNDLVDEVTRIVMGYFWGTVLNVLALRLRKSHENFSAVLLSGGMAVMYFVTFFAYSLYDLIPQIPAFILMTIFTAFTVFAALRYNRQVIAILGLVGAYAVPFLLSDGSGRVIVLFSYIAIINAGILVLSFRREWWALYCTAFGMTWLAYAGWYAFSFDPDEHITISLVFVTLFFAMFFTMFLSYKLIRGEPLKKADIVIMLLNSFLFFTYGLATVDSLPNGEAYLGIFAVATALLHFIGCALIYNRHDYPRDVFYFVAGMVLVFITAAVPIQLDGNWVTFIWAAEAFLLFWIGRTKGFPVYELLSYPLVIITIISLMIDWANAYFDRYTYTYGGMEDKTFLLNIHFLTSLFVGAALTGIIWINRSEKYPSPFAKGSFVNNLPTIIIPLLAICVVYTGFYKEIENHFNEIYAYTAVKPAVGDAAGETIFNYAVLKFQTLWLIYFSAAFMMILALLQHFVVRERKFMYLILGLNSIVIFFFLFAGLIELADLRYTYLTNADNPYFERHVGYLLIRYVGYLLVLPLFYVSARYLKEGSFHAQHQRFGAVLFHAAVVILLSSELVHWLEIGGVVETFKLGLTILWGSYALGLIVYGLRMNRRHLRMIAMALFGVTLIKLFFYDMADLSTLYKTIVMIILGGLLLVASFLYNKATRTTAEK